MKAAFVRFPKITFARFQKSVRKEVALTKVNANIKRILNSRYGMYQPIVGDDRESSAVSNYNDDLDELQRNVSD